MNQISFQDVYQASVSPAFAVGQRASTPDGRDWVYVLATADVAKDLVAIPAATVSVGTTITSGTNNLGQIVYITKASAGWTQGAYAGGWVQIDGGTGSGQTSKILSNSSDTLFLAPETALTTALSTDSTMQIWTQFNVRPSAVTSKLQNATGVPQATILAGQYGFALTRGIGAVIAGEVLVVGASFTTGDDTAGQVIKGITTNGTFDAQTIGICCNPNSGADVAALVFVTLDS